MITEKGQVKIMDFGLAKMRGSLQATKAEVVAGTVAYMSPEQARGGEVDQRTDIWSLGVLLYEMLAGQVPFRGDYEQAILYAIVNEEPQAVQALRPDVPESLAQIIAKMLAKNPEQRFQNMTEVLAALQHSAQLLQNAPTANKEKTSSIAVLPFTDMSAARDQEYFCEGVAEEILNSLSRIEGLRVTSRTSSFQLRETGQDVREMGKRLNVDSVLEGSVRKAGNRLRINVRLTNVSDGFHLWSERYDRNLEDIFAIQDDIAENVATALRGVLTLREKEDLRRPETAIETYEYFLKGRQLLHQLALEDARTMFRKAIELDDSYAPAYAGLANTLSLIYEWRDGKPEDLEAADRNSRKALELAPHLTESHTARGFVLSLGEHYDEAEQAFQEAIRLDPNSFDAYYYYARACFARGETERSAELFRKAGDVRREDFQSMILLAQSLDMLGLEKEAREADREAIRRVEHQLQFDPTDRRALTLGAFALYNEGQQERSFQWIEKALELYPDDVSVLTNSACLKARAGMKEEALDLLEQVFSQGFGQRSWIEHDPDYDSLRDDPRFQALLKKLR